MQESPFKKLLLVMVLLATGIALLLQLVNSRLQPKAQMPAPKIVRSDSGYHYTPPQPKISTNQPETQPEAENPIEPQRITREQAEAWLAKHNRNAMSLMAAFRAMGDTNYLNEAATNFPNDPRVELAILSRNAFPEERRKWLDLFKASSPSNSTANYFSAENYFKEGKTDEAVQELLAASGKSQFDSHVMEAQLDAEELYQDSGKPSVDAIIEAMADMSVEDMPEMATFKRVSTGIADSMKQKTAAGDAASTANLAQMGLTLADKLNTGDSGKYIINQMVGAAAETIVLRQLDQDTAYDFLNGQTPSQVLEQLKQDKAASRDLLVNFQSAQMIMMQNESELAAYMKRVQVYGEVAAMKWAVEQHPPAGSK